jgi:hypothetical protein
MNKNNFFILPILFIIFSASTFSSQDVKAVSAHPTTVTITPYNQTLTTGKTITFHAKVADHTPAKTTPYGTVTWSDGGKGGKFSSTSCTLVILSSSESICSVTYTQSKTGSFTITGSYGGGDGIHAGNSGTTQLRVILLMASTTTTITPNPATGTIGKAITFHAKIVDTAATKTLPTGKVTWTDGGKGGLFNSTCILTSFQGSTSESICAVTYTQSKVGSYTITGTYGVDSTHLKSSGTTPLTVTLRTTITTISGPVNGTIGTSVVFHAKVADSGAGAKTIPTGLVTWSDGSKGGKFSSTSCTLTVFSTSQSTCSVTYTQSTAASVVITGTYGGDSTHKVSTGMIQMVITLPKTSTTTTITPSPSNVIHTNKIIFTVTVTSISSGTKTSPSGKVGWSDGNKKGIFSSGSFCPLLPISSSASICKITYTASSSTGQVTITGGYLGDITHKTSFGTSALRVS